MDFETTFASASRLEQEVLNQVVLVAMSNLLLPPAAVFAVAAVNAFRRAGYPSLNELVAGAVHRLTTRPPIGVGYTKSGENAWRVAVRAPTTEDIERANLKSLAGLPEGSVDIVVGDVVASAPPGALSCRPIMPGYSIGHFAGVAGTLGAILKTPMEPSLLLSCNHVLANVDAAKLGDGIVQPAVEDGGTETVGVLHWKRDLLLYGNRVDVALAKLSGDFVAHRVSKLGRPAREDRHSVSLAVPGPRVGQRVRKWGRSTGPTTGRISGVLNGLRVSYPDRGRFFDAVYEVIPEGSPAFSAPGDSGALVVSDPVSPSEELEAVGLLFAGNKAGNRSYVIPIGHVLAEIPGATLVM